MLWDSDPVAKDLEPDRILTEQGRWVHINRPVDAPTAELEMFDLNEETLRDRFAMAALTGIISQGEKFSSFDVDKHISAIASNAYFLADAMMAERERAK